MQDCWSGFRGVWYRARPGEPPAGFYKTLCGYSAVSSPLVCSFLLYCVSNVNPEIKLGMGFIFVNSPHKTCLSLSSTCGSGGQGLGLSAAPRGRYLVHVVCNRLFPHSPV